MTRETSWLQNDADQMTPLLVERLVLPSSDRACNFLEGFMPKIHRIFIFAVFTLLAAILATRPALAQVDLSGGWLTKIHEDENDRSGGPDIGNYTGLPLNDAARLKADTWDAEE